MKNRDLFGLEKGLNAVGNLQGVKFGYAVSKNLERVMSELKSLTSTLTKDEEWQAIENLQQECHKKYCDKKDDGSQVVINGMLSFVEKGKEHEKALDAIEKKHKDAYAKRKELVEEYNKVLDEEVSSDFRIYKLKLEFVPEIITTQQLFGILPILEDEE